MRPRCGPQRRAATLNACVRPEADAHCAQSVMSGFPIKHAEFSALTKRELHDLADKLLEHEPVVVDYCIEFVLAETKGHWHGRARAMICRRLKHCELGRKNRTKLLDCILHRLRSGEFSEQFKDQLRLALHLDKEKTVSSCETAKSSDRPHVRRYAEWVLAPHSAHSV